ncbi:hypothetical protein GCM10023321_23920 [Pseudonocardia eucalypti]|uniref:HTH tetR-type domain-containing protein n=1 Tax=Pseudonocardia eucalypti TaxID=648755 RepID=A0ABP9PXD5_9PSEU|nr:AcrR family transcriptional regulator [Pseudonocardia eucalypti]
MAEQSRRERKKRQTRQLLVETAFRLFADQGYEQTTVAQIARAADVATKTFFNYFPSKEDVLFAESGRGNALPLELIAGRRPGETVAELLTRVYDEMLAEYLTENVGRDPELMRTYVRLVTTTPALLGKTLQLSLELQREMADALVKAYPDQLDPVSAAAVIGGFAGAAQGAALTSLRRGDSEEQFWAALRQGIHIALHGPPA